MGTRNLEKREQLRREISRSGLAALAINGLIGAGIFALPAAVIQQAGAFSPAVFAICGVLMLTVVLSFAQAASYFRGTGGPVLYAKTAFGSFVGFQTGWLLYIGRVTALAANSNALVDYGGLLWDGLAQGFGRALGILVCFVFFTTVNTVGVRRAMAATNLLTILKLLPLLLFIALGFSYIKPHEIVGATPLPLGSLAGTLLLVVYAFVGFEGAVVPAGESKNPRLDIPRALLLTLGFTWVLYVIIQTICVSVLPEGTATKTPVAEVARLIVGAPGAWIMTLAAFLSIAGNISSIMVTAPRMTYAMARDKTLPAWFGKVHQSHQTPATSIIFLGVVGLGLALTGTFVWLAIMSSLARLIGYGVCIAALPKLKKEFAAGATAFHLPGGLVIPAIALLLCVWLAAQADARSWGMTAAFMLAGTALYLGTRKISMSKNLDTPGKN